MNELNKKCEWCGGLHKWSSDECLEWSWSRLYEESYYNSGGRQ